MKEKHWNMKSSTCMTIYANMNTTSSRAMSRAYLCERIFFVILISQLYTSWSAYECTWLGHTNVPKTYSTDEC